VLLIVFGILGCMGSIQSAALPFMLDFQKRMMETMRKEMEESLERQRQARESGEANAPASSGDSAAGEETAGRGMPPAGPPQEIFSLFDEFLDVPAWFRPWAVVAGIAGVLVNLFCLAAGILLLSMRPSALKLTYAALGCSVAWAAVRIAVTVATLSFMLIMMSMWSVVGLLIDAVLLVVVALADKSAFRAGAEAGHAQESLPAG